MKGQQKPRGTIILRVQVFRRHAQCSGQAFRNFECWDMLTTFVLIDSSTGREFVDSSQNPKAFLGDALAFPSFPESLRDHAQIFHARHRPPKTQRLLVFA